MEVVSKDEIIKLEKVLTIPSKRPLHTKSGNKIFQNSTIPIQSYFNSFVHTYMPSPILPAWVGSYFLL